MRHIKRLLSLFACLALACVLVACSSTTQGSTTTTTEGFQGREARNASDLDSFVEKATTLADENIEKAGEDKEEGEAVEKSTEAFSAANDTYREGDYAKAQTSYEELIKSDPLHYGANVNLALAMLEQQKNEDALTQALACVRMFEDDKGVLLNVQVAGTACGFASKDIEDAASKMYTKSNTTAASKLKSGDVKKYWDYNTLWNDIETKLSGDPDESTYKELRKTLETLKKKLSDDDDTEYLEAYLDAVGAALGFDNATESGTDTANKK